MPRKFLEAEWRDLIMANYETDPDILRPFVPAGTELDFWNGVCYSSLVGFMFKNTRVKGFSFPYHTDFEEFNLRFYVRRKENGEWKRGVVFMKEIVPRHMITLVANTLYGEHYATHPMRNSFRETAESYFFKYDWRTGNKWNFISAETDKQAVPIAEGSEEEFITQHFWGYTRLSDTRTSEYEVAHPRWNVYPVKKLEVACSAAELYGETFQFLEKATPLSCFVAQGSEVAVLGKKVLSA